MEKPIEHKGKVVYVEGNRIDVEMTVQSACAECRVSKACGMGESAEKTISLLTATASLYDVGDEVIVSIEKKMGIKAAIYAYIIPFFVMIVVLAVMFRCGYPETVVGLSALASVALYYAILACFRKRIEKEIIFKLSKL